MCLYKAIISVIYMCNIYTSKVSGSEVYICRVSASQVNIMKVCVGTHLSVPVVLGHLSVPVVLRHLCAGCVGCADVC